MAENSSANEDTSENVSFSAYLPLTMTTAMPILLNVLLLRTPVKAIVPAVTQLNRFLYQTIFLTYAGFYLRRVHLWEPWNQAKQRNNAQIEGSSVEEFREVIGQQIGRYWGPYTRFFARRHLEKQCVVMARWWQEKERRERDELKNPVCRPLGVTMERRRLLAKKSPSPLHTMTRE